MSNPSWPSSLSGKLLSTGGYQEDAVDPTIRSSMDSGPPKMRPRFTAVPKTFAGSIDTLSSDEVDDLLDFYDTTCVYGSLPFTWVHPRKGTSATFQFTKRPTITSMNNSPIVFAASMNLIMLP